MTLDQVIAMTEAAMHAADAINHPLAGNHISAALDILLAARRAATAVESQPD
jgi:hypothetical protein